MTAAARSTALALGLAFALLAPGCLQSSADGAGGGAPPSAPPSTSPGTAPSPPPREPETPTAVELLPDFALGPCVAVSVQSAQPIAAVQALLPEGFEAAPFGTPDTAMVALDVYSCGNLTTPTGSIPDTVYGQAYTTILPPGDAVPGAPDAAVHEYVFRVLAAQDALASLWPAAGFDTRNGTANVTVSAPDLPLDAGWRLGGASVGPEYGALANGQHGAPAASEWQGSFARYALLADGSVLVWTGAYDVPMAYPGHGVFSVAADDPFAAFEAANNVPGLARLSESASMVDGDLSRIFP